MLSARFKTWKWYDIIFLLFVAIVIVAAIRIVAPTSGFSQALHQGFHAMAIGLEWVAGGLNALAGLLNQL